MIEAGIDILETKYYIKDNKKLITTSLENVFLASNGNCRKIRQRDS